MSVNFGGQTTQLLHLFLNPTIAAQRLQYQRFKPYCTIFVLRVWISRLDVL